MASEIEDRWKDIPALQALPSHIFEELKSFQEEADVLSKKKPVRFWEKCSIYNTRVSIRHCHSPL